MRMQYVRLAIVALLTLVAGCSSSPRMTVEQVREQSDQHQRDQIAAARELAEAQPKNARVALDYANTVMVAIEGGYYGRNTTETVPSQHVLSVLDIAASSQPGDAPGLMTKKAQFHFQLGDQKLGRETLYDVIAETTYVPAATLLVTSLGESGEVEEVVRVCTAFNPLIEYGEPKLEFMTKCVLASGATSSETGLYWATEEDRAYYAAAKAEHLEEQQRLEEERRQAQLLAQQQQAEEEAYRQEQLQRRQVCYSNCEEDNGYCRSDCGYVDRCYGECNRAREACINKCNLATPVPLSPQQKAFREQLGF